MPTSCKGQSCRTGRVKAREPSPTTRLSESIYAWLSASGTARRHELPKPGGGEVYVPRSEGTPRQRALGARRGRDGRFAAPSDSTFYRVLSAVTHRLRQTLGQVAIQGTM